MKLSFRNLFKKSLNNSSSRGVSPSTYNLMGWLQTIGAGDLSRRLAIGYYKSCFPVSSGINKISNSLKNIKPIICDENGEAIDTKINHLFAQPNPHSDWNDFIEKANLYDKTTGEIFVMIEGIISIKSIRILEVQHITIQSSMNRIKQFYYSNDGESYTFNVDEDGRYFNKNRSRELIYKFRPSPDGLTKGLGLVNGVSAQVESFMETMNHNLSLLKRQVKPSVIMKSKNNSFFSLDTESKESIEQYINEFYSGSINTGKPLITGDFDIDNLNDTNSDMDFEKLTKSTQNAVFDQLGIPLSLIDNSASTFNNKKTDTLSFYDDTIIPFFIHFTNWLAYNLSVRTFKDQERIYIKFNPTTIPALAERELENLTKRSKIGHMSLNEIREMDEFEEVDGGNVIYKPANEVPVAFTDESEETNDELEKQLDDFNGRK